jgi:alpha-glucosidase (family GH31 glycosyl hydrolase)
MNVRAHLGEPIVQPMYYDHPDEAAAYDVPNQFMFGTELLVAPITSPADRVTGLGRVKAWLPEGEWIDVFTGLGYSGGRTVYLHRDLTSIPVLAKAGAIVPMTPAESLLDGTEPPVTVEVRVYAGADGDSTLVEDRDDGRWARTRMTYDEQAGELTVHDVEGDAATLPADRTYRVTVVRPAQDTEQRVFGLLDRAQMDNDLKATIHDLVRDSASPGAAVLALQALDLHPPLLSALSELLLAR